MLKANQTITTLDEFALRLKAITDAMLIAAEAAKQEFELSMKAFEEDAAELMAAQPLVTKAIIEIGHEQMLKAMD